MLDICLFMIFIRDNHGCVINYASYSRCSKSAERWIFFISYSRQESKQRQRKKGSKNYPIKTRWNSGWLHVTTCNIPLTQDDLNRWWFHHYFHPLHLSLVLYWQFRLLRFLSQYLHDLLWTQIRVSQKKIKKEWLLII